MLSVDSSFPRRLDTDLASRILPATLARYRSAAANFSHWCSEHAHNPWYAHEWDEAVIEWKNLANPPKSSIELTVAAVEFFFPRFIGRWVFAREALDGIRRVYTPNHHTSCGRAPTALPAIYVASMGHPRLAGGIVLAQRRGLRPAELIRIMPKDIFLPSERPWMPVATCTIGLGMVASTKVKRPLHALLRAPDDADLIWFLESCKSRTPENYPLG